MTAVKRMATTNAFLSMPFKHRGCNVELFQECKTRRILEKCKCVPAEVQAFVGRDPKEYMRCTPEGRDSIQKIKLREDFNCSATCEGLHADVLFETDPLNKMISSRLGICRDRRDRRSCKSFVSCVNFSKKQRSFLHILQIFTHLNVNFLHN